MSNADDRFERLVADMLDHTAPRHVPASLLPEAERAVERTRRWPALWAALREPPMRHRSSVAVGSAAVRRVAILTATLLLVLATIGAGVAGAGLLGGPATIVVDQSGAGDATTIAEAVAEARDGDTILIRPGTYAEAIVLDKGVTIAGDGPEGAVIVSGGDGHLALAVMGSAPTVDGLQLDGDVHVEAGASPTIIGSRILGDVSLAEAGHVTFRGNDAFSLSVDASSSATVEGNVFASPDRGRGTAISVEQRHSTIAGRPVVIEGNRVEGRYAYGISVTNNRGRPVSVQGNAVRGADVALSARGSAEVRLMGNELLANGTAVRISSDSLGAVIADNLIESNAVGVQLLGQARPALSGNRFCGNEVHLDARSSPSDTLAHDQVCEEAATG